MHGTGPAVCGWARAGGLGNGSGPWAQPLLGPEGPHPTRKHTGVPWPYAGPQSPSRRSPSRRPVHAVTVSVRLDRGLCCVSVGLRLPLGRKNEQEERGEFHGRTDGGAELIPLGPPGGINLPCWSRTAVCDPTFLPWTPWTLRMGEALGETAGMLYFQPLMVLTFTQQILLGC